mmetsp:Transcript_59282/g.150100  ORF Transcript_59282/g.150100 Transcript_59282/m.150100 type:complete len:205 (-) Transcript_59282:308-922(-)
MERSMKASRRLSLISKHRSSASSVVSRAACKSSSAAKPEAIKFMDLASSRLSPIPADSSRAFVAKARASMPPSFDSASDLLAAQKLSTWSASISNFWLPNSPNKPRASWAHWNASSRFFCPLLSMFALPKESSIMASPNLSPEALQDLSSPDAYSAASCSLLRPTKAMAWQRIARASASLSPEDLNCSAARLDFSRASCVSSAS